MNKMNINNADDMSKILKERNRVNREKEELIREKKTSKAVARITRYFYKHAIEMAGNSDLYASYNIFIPLELFQLRLGNADKADVVTILEQKGYTILMYTIVSDKNGRSRKYIYLSTTSYVPHIRFIDAKIQAIEEVK